MIVAIIQARTDSARLPSKVLMDIEGKTMLERVIQRVKLSGLIDIIFVATTNRPIDDRVTSIAEDNDVYFFRGATNDVLDRFYFLATILQSSEGPLTAIVRVCADCPLLDSKIIDRVIQYFLLGKFDYVTNLQTYPDGADIEVFSYETLAKTWMLVKTDYDREHIGSFIRDHPELFNLGELRSEVDLSYIKISVDTIEELEYIREVYKQLGEYATMEDIIDWKQFHRVA